MNHIQRSIRFPLLDDTTDVDLTSPLTDHFNVDIVLTEGAEEFAGDADVGA